MSIRLRLPGVIGQALSRLEDRLRTLERRAQVRRELVPPVGGPVDTGFTWEGRPVYAARLRGTMPTSGVGTVLLEGVHSVVQVFGWGESSSGAVRISPLVGGSSVVYTVVTTATGGLALWNDGTTFDGEQYDIVVWFTRRGV